MGERGRGGGRGMRERKRRRRGEEEGRGGYEQGEETVYTTLTLHPDPIQI